MLAEYKRSIINFFNLKVLWDTIDVIMDIEIRRALPEEAEVLTANCNCRQRSLGLPGTLDANLETGINFSTRNILKRMKAGLAGIENQPIGFYTLREKDGNAWLENLWVIPSQIGTWRWKRIVQTCTSFIEGARLSCSAIRI